MVSIGTFVLYGVSLRHRSSALDTESQAVCAKDSGAARRVPPGKRCRGKSGGERIQNLPMTDGAAKGCDGHCDIWNRM
jgi:hypothetical protein